MAIMKCAGCGCEKDESHLIKLKLSLDNIPPFNTTVVIPLCEDCFRRLYPDFQELVALGTVEQQNGAEEKNVET